MTERELLLIVETLKEFRNILLGQQIKVFTDHKNLTHKNFNTERVLRWRLLLEEFNLELVYIKGAHNVVADALSRLDITSKSLEATLYSASNIELFAANKNELPYFPREYCVIEKYNKNDPAIKKLKVLTSKYMSKLFVEAVWKDSWYAKMIK
jgi:hypothetical protein